MGTVLTDSSLVWQTRSTSRWLLPYEWPWDLALAFGAPVIAATDPRRGGPHSPEIAPAMLGSVLAATDPVAVVALLNDLGASPVLTMVIAGESMLNDGVRSSSKQWQQQ